jgi:serine/threonine protein kinase
VEPSASYTRYQPIYTQGRNRQTLEIIAIKKVLQDPKYKNREYEILKELNHPNVLKMKDAFFTQEKGQ